MDEKQMGNNLKVLIVEAHPDDAVVACGGTISKLKRQGAEVRSIYFCPCTEDPKNKGHLEDHKRACEVLKIDYLCENKFARDVLEYHKQEVRDILYKLREIYKPDVVLCPNLSDLHQDHKAVAECCLTIFRDTSTILGYEVLRSVGTTFKPNVFVVLDESDVSDKISALFEYKSQMKGRPYFFSESCFRSHLEMRGTQARTKWAEAFELMWGRWK
jgi:LmbE family N-acetylglucosaminyl deacetylase